MSSYKLPFSFVLINSLIIVTLIPLLLCDAQELKICNFNAMYQLGDSISDTGNSIVEIPQAFQGRFPYGETIHNATGRPSDGLLMIDYFALSAGLPLLPPYENPKEDFSHGVDFAVAGVTALPTEVLTQKWNIPHPWSTNYLGVQVGWLEKYLSTICTIGKDCQEKLNSSLVVVGTIGCNDYDSLILLNHTLEEVKATLMPLVIQSVTDAVRKVIEFGASRVLVPGTFQMGCSPALLTYFQANNISSVYDSLGCLKDVNDLFLNHNNLLQEQLAIIQSENPNVRVVYGDIFHALQWVLDNLSSLGFQTFKQACCGIGGDHNFTPTFEKMCGNKGVPVCPNPLQHVFWDGGHLSHQANKYLSQWLIKDFLPKLQC